MNPFDLRGPEFLRLFFYVSALMLVAAAWVRWRLRVPGGELPEKETEELEPYEVAYLEGGDKGVAKAALSRLVHEQQVEFDFETDQLKQRTVMGKLDPVDAAMYRAVKPEPRETLEAAAGSCAAVIAPIRRRLQHLGLVMSDDKAVMALSIPMMMMSGVLILGVIKIAVGLSRDRPVTILVAACVVVLLLSLFACGRPIHRSRRGDLVLAKLRDKNAALKYQAEKGSANLTGNDLVLACALFTLHDPRLARLHRSLAPGGSIDGGGGYSGGSCGGGCGGGGCGGCGS